MASSGKSGPPSTSGIAPFQSCHSGTSADIIRSNRASTQRQMKMLCAIQQEEEQTRKRPEEESTVVHSAQDQDSSYPV